MAPILLDRAPAAEPLLYMPNARMKPISPSFFVRNKWLPEDVDDMLRHYRPQSDLGRLILRLGKMRDVPAEIRGELLEAAQRSVVLQSQISGIRFDGARQVYENLGVLSRKVVTTAGVGFWVDAWQNSVEMENMRYHAFGSDNTAEASGNTALVTEYTTQYVDNERPQGSLTEGASANIFRTVGTFAPDSGGTLSVEEHGILSQQATGGGVLWDRSLTGTVSLVASSDSLQVTYDMTATAGG